MSNAQQFHDEVMSELEMREALHILEERAELFPMDREIEEFAAEHECQLKEKHFGQI